ncbi:MBL fold metallo-hydrolase [Nostocoides sp. F2B08]|uniref:MBL fold metallo-hydrolase n=1 Tax=Nostocoides sp. F2B08 TaxID=2653936 RepID=UPI001263165D|nr:MBL fold metallo-hydrolase [Tetrasphaera sp. F2B08]KAB7743304.1 MBL fold metallo-hydrolase [Tetrasphaera sp. F2B08]
MRLRVFFASDGDCLLLTSGDGRHVLIDGGRSGTFTKHTRPSLDELAAADEPIDLVVVSHTDADHISGVISLLKEVAAWEVYDYQVNEQGNTSFPKPRSSQPPAILGLWHNSWRAQVQDLEGPISAFAGRVAEALELTSGTAEGPALDSIGGLAESIADGVTLLHLVDDETPISRNEAFGSGLVLLRDPVHEEQVGTMSLRVIGPAERHLKTLRDEWRDWLERQPGTTTGRDTTPGSGVESSTSTLPMSPAAARAMVREIAAATLTDDAADAEPAIIEKTRPSAVSPPNRASITLLVEEDGHTLLLTGDAAEEEILDGLEAAGCFEDGDPFRCSVVKVQHHGSEHNLSRGFASRVLADHYVFCADGAHANPNPSVVKTLLETRLMDARPFTVWFNCSVERTLPQRRKALRAALHEAHRLQTRHPGQLTVRVLQDDQAFFDIEV